MHGYNQRDGAVARVEQFGTEYDAQWQIAAPLFNRDDAADPMAPFATWRELMAVTKANHFTESSAVNLAGSFGTPPAHGPQAETIVNSEIAGDVAYILTQSQSYSRQHHEYTLHRTDGDWKIVSIEQHFGLPTEPFIERDAVDARVSECSSDAPFNEMPQPQAQLDEVRNFTARDVVRPRDGEQGAVEISSIGTMVTASGVLTVVDFGYDNDDARPLARTVAPGSYAVDRVTAFGRNAAVRVCFNDNAVTTWHPASRPTSGHVVGVDAGCICIVDYVGYSAMTRREKSASYEQFVTAPRPAAFVFELADGGTGIAVDSGYGDGSYPAYWGVDATGAIAQLVIDFMVLVTEDDDGVFRHL